MKSNHKFFVLVFLMGILLKISCLKEGDPNPIGGSKGPGTELTRCNIKDRAQINAQLTPIGSLSKRRAGLSIATMSNRIIFAGGFEPTSRQLSSRVDIFDLTTKNWSTYELSVPRVGMAIASNDNKVFFAGGGNLDDLLYTTIDIYDASANTWSVESMNRPISGSFGVLGYKIFFSEGSRCDGVPCSEEMLKKIYIYDLGNKTWSTTQLSEGRTGLSIVSSGNKIHFAGGWTSDTSCTNKIDIYDVTTSTWHYDTLAQGRAIVTGFSTGNLILFAGGATPYDLGSNLVEITDISTQTTSIECLFQPNLGFTVVLKNNLMVFFTGVEWMTNVKNKFDIYDLNSKNWSIGVLDKNIAGASIIAINNTIYVAGGYVDGVLSDQVWKLEF